MALSFKALQPFEPRLWALPYAAFPGVCVDCTDCGGTDTDTTETDTDVSDGGGGGEEEI